MLVLKRKPKEEVVITVNLSDLPKDQDNVQISVMVCTVETGSIVKLGFTTEETKETVCINRLEVEERKHNG